MAKKTVGFFIWAVIFIHGHLPAQDSTQQTVWPQPGTTSTGGWLQTLWHQEYPFNARCPFDTVRHSRSLVGCVGLAMAQIINYYAYQNALPIFSAADNYLSTENGFLFHVDSDCGTHNTLTWPALNQALQALTFPIADESESGLADELCFSAAVSVQTLFSSTNSEAFDARVPQALRSHFGFKDPQYLYSTDSTFFSVLKNNIKNGEPAIVILTRSGQAPHAVVVDGFDEKGKGPQDDLYHLNYGGLKPGLAFWWNLWPGSRLQYPLSNGFDMIKGAIVNTVPPAALKPPRALFSADPVHGYTPLSVRFDNQSLGDITACDWDFGDDSKHDSTFRCFHTYTKPGNYTVTLTVTGPLGMDQKTCTSCITVSYTPFQISEITLPGFADVEPGWGDYDADGDLDLVFLGRRTNQLLRNDGKTFSIANLPLSYSELVEGGDWLDIDGDNDLDLWVTATNASNKKSSRIYVNIGGVFTTNEISLPASENRQLVWGDYDNDGDLDLLLAGSLVTNAKTGESHASSTLYQNNAMQFIATGIALDLYKPLWFDADNDGDLDLLGRNGILARNQQGRFSEEKMDWRFCSTVAIADHDDNGQPDIIIAGKNETSEIKIYLNQNGLWQANNQLLPPLYKGYLLWLDYDSDGESDLLLGGQQEFESFNTPYTKLFHAEKSGGYQSVPLPLAETTNGNAVWGDYDNDGDPDFLVCGITATIRTVSQLYDNVIDADFNLPEPPSSPSSETNGAWATLHWSAPEQAKGYTYNLCVGTGPGKADVMAPLAIMETGRRLVAGPGNAWYSTTWKLRLAAGTYYWRVQCVDKAYCGSAFTAVQSFTIQPDADLIPMPPPHVTAKREAQSVIMSWQPDSTDSVLRYTVYRRCDGAPAPIAVLGHDLNSFCDNNILENTVYYYSITATNRNRQESAPSAEIRIDTSSPFVRHTTEIPTGDYFVFGDLDSDGDLDIVQSRKNSQGQHSLFTYSNQHQKLVENSLPYTLNGGKFSIEGDDDRDNDLDLFAFYSTHQAKLFRNNAGRFTLYDYAMSGTDNFSIETMYRFDLDNDGDQDALVSGWLHIPSQERSMRVNVIFENQNGLGRSRTQPFEFDMNAFEANDFDLDGDVDLLASGSYWASSTEARWLVGLYINANGNFYQTDSTIIPWPPKPERLWQLQWFDYDQDARPDILFNQNGEMSVFINQGRRFAPAIPVHDLGSHFIAQGDLNNDNRTDIITLDGDLSIKFSDAGGYNEVYRSNFLDYGAAAQLCDYDQDGDLDVFLTQTSSRVVWLENLTPNTRTRPTAPTGLSATVQGDSVLLAWESDSDNLTYNIYVGTRPGQTDIVSPLSDISTGFHKLVAGGNAGLARHHLLRTLPVGLYYWSVQAIDNRYMGGPFAEEQNFIIDRTAAVTLNANSIPDRFVLQQNYPNPFNGRTEIPFHLPQQTMVALIIYDLSGKTIRILGNGNYPTGAHHLDWDGLDDRGMPVASGIYIYRLQTGRYASSKKMVLVR